MIRKKIYGVGLALCMFFTMSGGAALASPSQTNIQDRYILSEFNGNEAVFDTVEESYYISPVDASGVKVDIEDYKDSLNISDKLSKGAAPESLSNIVNESLDQQDFTAKASTKRYVQDLGWSTTLNPLEISAWLDCPKGQTPCSIAAASTITRSEEFSTEVTAGFKEIITSSVSFTWAKSASSSITMTLPVAPGVRAKMTFAPKRNYTRGKIWDGLHSSEMLYANCPAILSNGIHDGIYALKYN